MYTYCVKNHVLNDEELWDAADSLMWVNDAAVYRMKDLKGETHALVLFSF